MRATEHCVVCFCFDERWNMANVHFFGCVNVCLALVLAKLTEITRTPNTDERRSQPELKRVRKSIKGCPFRFHWIDSIDSWIVPNRSCFLRPRIDDRKFINREKCTRYSRVHNNIYIARMDYTLAQSSKRPLLDCQLPWHPIYTSNCVFFASHSSYIRVA